MGVRTLLAAALALAGALLLAFATLPPGMAGHGVATVPVKAEVLDRVATTPAPGQGDTATSTIRYRYVVDGEPHHAAFTAPDAAPLASGNRRVADLHAGDALDLWIDPNQPGPASLFRQSPIGPDGPQILLGLALLASGAVFAVTRRRRKPVA